MAKDKYISFFIGLILYGYGITRDTELFQLLGIVLGSLLITLTLINKEV